ncbi:unnamed protein product [Prorocentrum cordatum]|uniref:Uncharacterized protein n=1 Tax=Prorocentrum cordatum TaxID=2364126 RepID=A0ABN9QG45_9DINO|nr:unnamed protein product [Polarella glacialis]
MAPRISSAWTAAASFLLERPPAHRREPRPAGFSLCDRTDKRWSLHGGPGRPGPAAGHTAAPAARPSRPVAAAAPPRPAQGRARARASVVHASGLDPTGARQAAQRIARAGFGAAPAPWGLLIGPPGSGERGPPPPPRRCGVRRFFIPLVQGFRAFPCAEGLGAWVAPAGAADGFRGSSGRAQSARRGGGTARIRHEVASSRPRLSFEGTVLQWQGFVYPPCVGSWWTAGPRASEVASGSAFWAQADEARRARPPIPVCFCMFVVSTVALPFPRRLAVSRGVAWCPVVSRRARRC